MIGAIELEVSASTLPVAPGAVLLCWMCALNEAMRATCFFKASLTSAILSGLPSLPLPATNACCSGERADACA
jgi:hypothetical protein